MFWKCLQKWPGHIQNLEKDVLEGKDTVYIEPFKIPITPLIFMKRTLDLKARMTKSLTDFKWVTFQTLGIPLCHQPVYPLMTFKHANTLAYPPPPDCHLSPATAAAAQ